MFKYISSILKEFTPKQRIMALLCILLTSIVLTLGPNFINRITYDDTELKGVISAQKVEIEQLKSDVAKLNDQIRINQINCTNQIVAREKEILQQVNDLMKYVNDQRISQRMEKMMIQKSDSTKNDSSKIIVAESKKEQQLMLGLSIIKTNLENSIKKNTSDF